VLPLSQGEGIVSQDILLGIDLLRWYDAHKRSLPWRDQGASPYRTWVSEIMLQQTRVDTVIPYFERFMERFPTLETLASADLDDVLELWSGLGYYSRARNLHRGAQEVHAAGRFPSSVAELKALPGVGDYISRAIASIALGLDVATVDGNIERVLSRIHCVRTTRTKFFETAARHLPPGRAGDYNQALMDLGATICTPRGPNCEACPIMAHCTAQSKGEQSDYPGVKARRRPRPQSMVALVLRSGDGLLMVRRPQEGLFGGLYDLPGGPKTQAESIEEAAARIGRERLGMEVSVGGVCGKVEHTLTHLRVTLYLVNIQASGAPSEVHYTRILWVTPDAASELGISSLAKKALKALITLD
jgi:A/G-specific adenine glycosylase